MPHLSSSLISLNGQSHYVHSLWSENGQELTQSSKIRQQATWFYNKLYVSDYREDEEMSAVFNADLPRVPKNLMAQLETPLVNESFIMLFRTWRVRKGPRL